MPNLKNKLTALPRLAVLPVLFAACRFFRIGIG